VASGESGIGRMTEPAVIVAAISLALGAMSEARPAARGSHGGDLHGRRIVVTAGPTHEAIDPVRYLGNRSSGRMGFAVAARAAARGATVTLIAGPVNLATPPGVHRVDVESAVQMQRAIDDAMGPDLGKADALVMAAAVADFRAAQASATKIKKDAGTPAIALAKNPDLLAAIGDRRSGKRPLLVGFALETGDDALVLAYAKAKLVAKKVDFVVANAARDSLGHSTNRVSLVSTSGAEPFVEGSKEAVADRILAEVSKRLAP
jgi:phosphopantothenoylcysteine decarboxylase/phosphopantothenate--cysteine ligase